MPLMGAHLVWKVKEGSNVKLKDYDPDYVDEQTERDSADSTLEKLGSELSELQELMSAAQKNSLLVILQGTDTSGKDGTIRHIFTRVNPQGCFVHSFKQPTDEDLISKCSTGEAPWYIVPSNHKWYRNLAIADTLVAIMREYKDAWKADLEERGRKALAELQKMRQGQ